MSGIIPEEFIERLGAIHRRIEAALPASTPRHVCFSAYDTEVVPGVGTMPVDNLDAVAVQGDAVFRSEGFVSQALHSPTFLDLALVANQALIATKSFYCPFFEEVRRTEESTPDGIAIYDLILRF